MAIPGSGPVSLSEIQTEFGGSNPISLSEYYGADTGVPGSGTISVSDFYGTSSSDVTMDFLSFSGTLGPGNDNEFATVSGINTTVELEFTSNLTVGSAQAQINSGTLFNIDVPTTANVNNGDTITLYFTDASQSGQNSVLNGTINIVNNTDGGESVGIVTSSSWSGGGF